MSDEKNTVDPNEDGEQAIEAEAEPEADGDEEATGDDK